MIQEERHQVIQDCNNQIQFIQHENIGLQDEIQAKDQVIATLQKCYVSYLANNNKSNGITIISKNDEAAKYPYISRCGQYGYRKQGSLIFWFR